MVRREMEHTPTLVAFTFLVPKEELELFQLAAVGLTEAGIGNHTYAVASEQVMPRTKTPLSTESSYIVINYNGQRDMSDIGSVVGGARLAMERVRGERKNYRRSKTGR